MISFMFYSHLISSSTWLRGEPLSLLYSLFFNELGLFPFNSVLSFEQETWAKWSRGDSYIGYLMQATFFMNVLSFLMHVGYFEKTDQKIVSIGDISRHIVIKSSISWRFRRYGQSPSLFVLARIYWSPVGKIVSPPVNFLKNTIAWTRWLLLLIAVVQIESSRTSRPCPDGSSSTTVLRKYAYPSLDIARVQFEYFEELYLFSLLSFLSFVLRRKNRSTGLCLSDFILVIERRAQTSWSSSQFSRTIAFQISIVNIQHTTRNRSETMSERWGQMVFVVNLFDESNGREDLRMCQNFRLVFTPCSIPWANTFGQRKCTAFALEMDKKVINALQEEMFVITLEFLPRRERSVWLQGWLDEEMKIDRRYSSDGNVDR